MKKEDDLPSFPSSKDSTCQSQHNVDNDEELNAVLNVSFIESLDDFTKFSYASLCATILHLLYDSAEERDFRHTFATSFVAHLCLPSSVSNTMQAVSDGHGNQTTEVFIDSLSKSEIIKNDLLLLVNDMVMWALTSSSGRYDARTRFVIRHVLWKMNVKYEDLEKVEEMLIEMLRESTEKEKLEQEAIRSKKAKSRKWKRYALIGLATAGGGALIGLTGGLAAPLVAAGAGAILGGASAAALGSVAGIAIITSLFGAAGAGLTGYKMKRRVGGIDEFLFKPLTVSNQPSIAIAVSGWLSDDCNDAFMAPWQNMLCSKEQYSLVWESKHLIRLGNAFEYIINSLVSVAATEALKYTVLAGLITAIAWPASLVSAAGVIDNPWSVCLQRAVQVGRQLAEVLLAREHGHRPVTLIGYSLGARVIYHCLEEMSKRKNHQGVIEDVYLLGAPVTGKPEDWEKLSSVVAGHITNGYCRSDWLLKFLYRTSSAQVKVAGLHPIKWENRRMINLDLSSVIDGHLDYANNMETILLTIGVRTKHAMKPKKVKKSSSSPALTASKQVSVVASSQSDDRLVHDGGLVTTADADSPTEVQSESVNSATESLPLEVKHVAANAPTDSCNSTTEVPTLQVEHGAADAPTEIVNSAAETSILEEMSDTADKQAENCSSTAEAPFEVEDSAADEPTEGVSLATESPSLDIKHVAANTSTESCKATTAVPMLDAGHDIAHVPTESVDSTTEVPLREG